MWAGHLIPPPPPPPPLRYFSPSHPWLVLTPHLQPRRASSLWPPPAWFLTRWVCLAACVAPRLLSMSEEDAVAYLIPYVPGQHMQSVGTNHPPP